MQEKKEAIKQVKSKKFMNRNVTQFRHLMKKTYITESDLNWVINLRDNQQINIEPHESSPPDVYFKNTKAYQTKMLKNVGECIRDKVIAHQYDYMILKGNPHTHQTHKQLQFYNSLRKDHSHATIKSQKTFDSIPFKDRRQMPTFIKKENVRKVKAISRKDQEPCLDGAHKQQPYTQNILKTKNYGLLQSFTKIHGRSQVSLPSLAWQVGLRNYR